MEMKNLKYNHVGTIDAEINHPVHGWILCTLSPNDAPTAELYTEAFSGIHGTIATYVAPILTPDEIARIALKQVDAEAVTLAKADNTIKYLVNHTPDEINTYITTNVTNLASAVIVLSKLAIALSVIAKDKLR